jgi:hybrid cluster-associated redox disulfide protein
MKKQTKTKKIKADKNLITKKMTFAEIMRKNPEAGRVLMEKGMHCVGCGMAMMETLEQGAIVHGLDPDKLVKELNQMKKK